MSSPTLSETSRIGKAALSRWKLETLTGLLGYRSLKHHQRESEKNIEAENQHVRRSVWGDMRPSSESDDDMGHTILGDYNPPQVIMPRDNGIGKVLAGAAIAAGLLGIPAAGAIGYFAANLLKPTTTTEPAADSTVDLGLLRVEDLKQQEKQ